jgi:hypothetical protein
MIEELLIFVGYSQDANEEAQTIRELEPSLQETLKRLKQVATSRSKYTSLKIFNWEYDAKLGVGGQSFAINPYLDRAAIAIFVFKQRIGKVTWEELEQVRDREPGKRIPTIALFSQTPPNENLMTSPDVVASWLDLLNKKVELTRDWDEASSRSITPLEPYRDRNHLKEILFNRLEDILASLIEHKEPKRISNEESLQSMRYSTDYLDCTTDSTDYDSHAVQQYRSLLRMEVRLSFPPELSDSEFLRKTGYLKGGKLTAAGVLLFTSHPSKVIPSAVIRCTKYDGVAKSAERKRRNCDGPLISQILAARDFIAENTGSRERPVESSMQSNTIYQYPMICVREILANAACHRDYDDNARLTYVTIYSDRIEIKSPGNWINPTLVEGKTVPLQHLLGESIQRNMRLAHAICSVDMVEMEGSGIPSAIHDCRECGSPEPSVILKDGYVVVTIYPKDDWERDNKSFTEDEDISEYENILDKGVDTWNQWRSVNPNVRPNLTGIDLSNRQLVNVNFSWTDLTDAKLMAADLFGANFSNAVLKSTNLVKANLVSTNLSSANLSKASLIDAKLDNARLYETIFSDTDLTNVTFSLARLRSTIFANVKLVNVSGLEDCEHLGPSSIDLNTIYSSEGTIPEIFLRNAGMSDILIEYMHSLTVRPIEYYSCFISYSSKDQNCAERLHTDLQRNHVRCWFAPEDLKTGDKFRDRIEESIRIYDKLLLILSEHSVASPWVEREVRAALEREDMQNRIILFPLRIDDSIMTTDKDWATELRTGRHIADFRQWKDHDAYQTVFKRLLGDLTAGEQSK